MKIKISYKFFAGFLIIFSLAFILMNYLVGRQIEKNNEELITQDLIYDRQNLNIYIRQNFLLKDINISEGGFITYGKEIIKDLKLNDSNEIAAFRRTGESIYSTNSELFSNKERGDFKNALDGEISFTIKREKSVRVFFSFPLTVNGTDLGIISIAKDYSQLYNSTDRLLEFILLITIVIFAVLFIFSVGISRSITIPIIKLSKVSKDISAGNFEARTEIKARDEIGELSINFFKMVDTLKEQIETIKSDRDKLRELSNHRKQFFDSVTHELKTPLTSILGYGELLKDIGFKDEAFFDKATNHIIEESKRLHGMVIKILELSKEENVESKYDFEEINVTEVLKKVSEDMSFKAKRYNSVIQCDLSEQLYTFGDKDRLKEVFINIIDNSIKYGKRDNVILINANRDKEYINIRICDKGIGMSKEQLENIFEPFYRTDKRKSREIGSCGLGLSIVQAILNTHEGEIRFESQLNEGTTAIIKLKNLQA